MEGKERRPICVVGWDDSVKALERALSLGRPATMPDLVEMRSNTENPRDTRGTWYDWFDSHTAEYFLPDDDGRATLIVADGVGPLSTPEGIEKATKQGLYHPYRKEWMLAPQITTDEFLALKNGEYGDAEVVNPAGVGENDLISGAPVRVLDLTGYLEHHPVVTLADYRPTKHTKRR